MNTKQRILLALVCIGFLTCSQPVKKNIFLVETLHASEYGLKGKVKSATTKRISLDEETQQKSLATFEVSFDSTGRIQELVMERNHDDRLSLYKKEYTYDVDIISVDTYIDDIKTNCQYKRSDKSILSEKSVNPQFKSETHYTYHETFFMEEIYLDNKLFSSKKNFYEKSVEEEEDSDDEFEYVYDETGKVLKKTDLTNSYYHHTWHYEYNARGDCVKSFSDTKDNDIGIEYITEYQYDQQGNWIEKKYIQKGAGELIKTETSYRTIEYYDKK